MAKPPTLDPIDVRILDLLQQNGCLSSAEVADRVGLSQSPCWRRITSLEENGAIRQRVALLDRERLGLSVMVYIQIKLANQERQTVDAFRKAVTALPEVTQCHMLMGDIDFLLVAITADIEAYRSFLRESLSKLPGVAGIDSRLVLEEVKNSTLLPLNQLATSEQK